MVIIISIPHEKNKTNKKLMMSHTKLLSKDYIFSIDPPRLRRVPPDTGDARRAGGLSLITIVIVLV